MIPFFRWYVRSWKQLFCFPAIASFAFVFSHVWCFFGWALHDRWMSRWALLTHFAIPWAFFFASTWVRSSDVEDNGRVTREGGYGDGE